MHTKQRDINKNIPVFWLPESSQKLSIFYTGSVSVVILKNVEQTKVSVAKGHSLITTNIQYEFIKSHPCISELLTCLVEDF